MDEKQESNEEKISSDYLKIESENVDSSNEPKNIILNLSKNNENEENYETTELKSKSVKSEFEKHIVKAYKKLIGSDISFKEQNENNNNEINEEEENIKENNFSNSESKMNIKRCENEIRLALKSCIETKMIDINKNILDTIGKIVKYNKINLLFLIGKIYINLMNKDYLFNPLNNNIDKKMIISFCNEAIILNSLLKQTYLENKFNKTLIYFIAKIMNNYTFEKEQLSVMKKILENRNINKKTIEIKANSYADMIKSINDNLNTQENIYNQYKLIIENMELISNIINSNNISEKENNTVNNINNYLILGNIFDNLLFNKKFVVYLKKVAQENDIKGNIITMFDGYQDNFQIYAIEGEKFYVEYDEDIEQMREDICDLIIKYVEKYKHIKNSLDFQYTLYVLIKRIYFNFYDKYKDKLEALFVEIMTNLCFFKEEKIDEIKLFLNEILKSQNEKDDDLKELIQEKLKENKSNSNFNFDISQNYENKEDETNENNEVENYFSTIDNMSIESINIFEYDLNIAFFKSKIIKAGEIFTFYVELDEPYSILDFCMIIENYDIKLKITNLTEGREVYNQGEITLFHCPLKLTMFFTKPGIFQFELDNSYSWIRSKSIKYKVNKFYPLKPYYVERRIILMKYNEIINKSKNFNNINTNKEKEKIFLVKFNGENNSYNCNETSLDMKISNKMITDNYLKISSIFIEKNNDNEESYFYVKDNNKLIRNKLNKEKFTKFIHENIIPNTTANIDIINLYIITNNSNIIDTHYISIEEMLGFEPEIKSENNNCKILFFMEYLHQAQLIYFLFKKINNDEKICITLLINYTSISGFQICFYKDGEIFIKMENLYGLSKNESLEKNMEIIADKIKEFGKENNIEILITENIDVEDKEMTAQKIGEQLIKNLDINKEDEGNMKVIYLNQDFNKEVSLNSHIFYI